MRNSIILANIPAIRKKNSMTATKVKSRRKAPSPNSILDRPALEQALDDRGISVSKIHIDTLYQALHRQHYPDLPEFVETFLKHDTERGVVPKLPLKNKVSLRKNVNKSQLPKKFIEFLQDPDNGFVTLTSKVYSQKTSSDGTTTKLAIELHDGSLVESVLMRIIGVESSRASLCVSSQVGCAMGCTFCATGTMGLSGNLTTGEILEQLVHADNILAQEWLENRENTDKKLEFVRNIVFMGMGEPLDNYRNVLEAARGMIDTRRWNLAPSKVTISTVGLVSQIRKLTLDLPQISLALSLHAPTQAKREEIVPTACRYPIEDLIDAIDNHMMAFAQGSANGYTKEERIKQSTRRRAMIEYVMLEGPTSTLEAAHELGKLCEGRQLIVNLIPYNQTDVKDKLRCPSREHMEEFRSILASYGTFATIRRTMGADIDSACGQLVRKESSNDETTDTKVLDIEDIGQGRLLKKESTIESVLSKTSFTTENESGSETPSDLEGWIRPLQIATSIAATCFIVSCGLYVRQRKR